MDGSPERGDIVLRSSIYLLLLTTVEETRLERVLQRESLSCPELHNLGSPSWLREAQGPSTTDNNFSRHRAPSQRLVRASCRKNTTIFSAVVFIMFSFLFRYFKRAPLFNAKDSSFRPRWVIEWGINLPEIRRKVRLNIRQRRLLRAIWERYPGWRTGHGGNTADWRTVWRTSFIHYECMHPCMFMEIHLSYNYTR